MLQHPARQMAADGLQDVIRHAHLGQLGDRGVPQIMKAQAVQASFVSERSPSCVPLQHRLRRS